MTAESCTRNIGNPNGDETQILLALDYTSAREPPDKKRLHRPERAHEP